MPWNTFKFKLVEKPWDVPSEAKATGYLLRDNWDDFGHRTSFSLTLFDLRGEKIDVGGVKIADIAAATGYTKLPKTFKKLPPDYVSLGMQASYYENLRQLPKSGWTHILTSLSDLAYDEELWEEALKHDVVSSSLLRSTPRSLVEGQLRRIARGGKFRTAYNFTYHLPKRSSTGPLIKLGFEVDPESPLPTNVHAIIGRNGVGKSYLFDLMSKALLAKDSVAAQSGKFLDHSGQSDSLGFTGVVTMSFSAFDQFQPITADPDNLKDLGYTRISLMKFSRKKGAGKTILTPKTSQELETEFSDSGKEIISRGRVLSWRKAVKNLESDPGFSDLDILDLLDIEAYFDTSEATQDNPVEFQLRFAERASGIFRQLSSGHKIVLLAVTRLIECVEEKTLVMIDEPEGHLHPPLLSAFVRSLSDLMSDRNGLAIIATHSPVVLQEVPMTCVWQLARYGSLLKAHQPEQETFGENVGILTSRVFQQEVTESGFHQILTKIAQESENYESALKTLGGSLGSEAKAILMGLTEIETSD